MAAANSAFVPTADIITVGGRNLKLWTNYTGADPESNYNTGDTQSDFATTSPPRYFIVRLNLHY